MGVLEATQEAHRRYAAERAERLAIEQAALTAKQAEAAEAERNKDRDERRESARRDARLNAVTTASPLDATAIAANSAAAAFDAAQSDPAATVETLFSAFVATTATAAVHSATRKLVEQYRFAAANPGQPVPARYIDRTPQPSFSEVLDRVVAARAAAAAALAGVQPELFSKADAAGERAAEAIER
ncbi:MAG TPA: hypothetical protein VNI34_05440 [Candidatus Nitrosotalea sp.]|nr:hypothetical protein [Candidatus Nitrosotalea sp.]